MRRAAAAALAAALAAPAAAGTLEGRIVTLHVMTWDDPAAPYFDSQGRTVTVGAGLEFGMGPEFRTPDFDVVPVQVEIGPTRIEFSYAEGEGQFWPATFNGYVLRFETECALFDGWKVDAAATTMPVTDDDIFTNRGTLFINVQGLDFGPDQRLAVDLSVTDCPLS
jgi:hypothetical protein